MEIQAVSTLQEFLALAPEWQRLWERQRGRTVFQHHAWLAAFLEAYCATEKWLVLTARKGGVLAAVLPVWDDSKAGHWRLIGSPNADYQVLLGEEDALTALMRSLAAHGARALLLESMPEGKVLFSQLADQGFGVVADPTPVPCPHLELTPAKLEAVCRRGGMKDNLRRLAKIGPLRLRMIEGETGRLAMLETLFEQHRRKWDVTQGTSQFHDEATRAFYRCLCRAPALADILHFSVLEAGEQVLACHFGFICDSTFIYYKPSFDTAFKGSGMVMIGKLMEEALRLGLREFDFTRGSEPYKFEMATGVRHNHDAHVFFSAPARWRFLTRQWLLRKVPRDADGLAITTRLARKVRSMVRGG